MDNSFILHLCLQLRIHITHQVKTFADQLLKVIPLVANPGFRADIGIVIVTKVATVTAHVALTFDLTLAGHGDFSLH